jgi:hypothetical protein
MNANPLQAVATGELVAMRLRAYRLIWVQTSKVEAAEYEAAFLRYDDELEAREVPGLSRAEVLADRGRRAGAA